jgi:hypothetical protein
MDPFTLRDDDCWDCIVGELGNSDADLAEQLREALDDPLRNLPLSTLAMFTTTYRVQIDMAASGCRAQLRCTH